MGYRYNILIHVNIASKKKYRITHKSSVRPKKKGIVKLRFGIQGVDEKI